MEKKQIGVLAVQGAFAEHIAMVRKLGAEAFEIRQLPDLERPMDGLILPGGESTAMRKLLDELGLYEPLRAKIAAGLPVYGTCAGLLLLAQGDRGRNAVLCDDGCVGGAECLRASARKFLHGG